MFFFQEGFTYRNFLMDMIAIFAFVVWFWLIIIIYSDLFRRHNMSGWGKALWVLALVLTSYFGIFAYVITPRERHGRAQRSAGSTGGAINYDTSLALVPQTKSLSLISSKKSGSITDVKYGRLRAKLGLARCAAFAAHTRRRGDGIGMLFAAVHESVVGTNRTSSDVRSFGRYQGESGHDADSSFR